jgi:hypothetical protein
MSVILSLDTKEDAELFPQLLNLITKYEKYVDEAEPLFNLDGKKLEEVCRILPKNLVIYDRHYYEMKTLEEWMVVKREKIQSKLWKKFLEGYPRALASKDIQMYIQGDPEYVGFTEVILEVANIKSKLQSIVKAFENMSWMLGHVTKLRIAELQDTVL